MVAINGFAVSADRDALGIRTFTVPGTSVRLPVRADVAPLLIGFARDFHEHVERLDPGCCWGYAYRSVRGSSTPSFHAAGIAIDLNAPRHPLGKRGTFSPGQAADVRRLAARYGLRWGGDYQRRADEMHVEVILGRQQALELAAAVQGGAQVPDGPGAPRTTGEPQQQYEPYAEDVPLGSRTLRRGRAGDDVAFVQRWTGAADDGRFGPGTEAAVRRYQDTQGLVADGVVGRATWTRMGVAVPVP